MTRRPRLPLTGERTVPGLSSETYWFRRHLAAYRWADRLAADGVLLDAGAGEGYGAALLARRRRTLAVELAPDAAGHAAHTYGDVLVIRADCCALPVRDRSLDTVACLQVVEHLQCAERFVAACARSLRPGGRLLISTPNRATFPAGLNPFHSHEYVAGELEELLRGSFEDVRVLGLEHRLPLRALDRFIGEPVQHRLIARPYAEQPAWMRAVLRSVTSRDFRATTSLDRALDLLAVATATIEG